MEITGQTWWGNTIDAYGVKMTRPVLNILQRPHQEFGKVQAGECPFP